MLDDPGHQESPMFRWIANLIRVQEKRPFHGENVIFFAFFVGSMRAFLEIFLVGDPSSSVYFSLMLNVTWYWLCFFAFGLPVKLFAPPPWENRINVMLVGLFLGFLPPIIDVLIRGWGNALIGIDGFRYSYIFNFPEGWVWSLIAPGRNMPWGEGLILWGAIGFTGVYLWLRTRSAARTIAGMALSYAVCVIIAGVIPTAIRQPPLGRLLPDLPEAVFLIYAQLIATIFIYLIFYRFKLLLHLSWRFVHALPLLAMALVGFAWVRPLGAGVVGPLALISLSGLMTIAQNDHWDDLQERPNEPERVRRHDVIVLTFTWVMVTLQLIITSSTLAYPMIIYGVASYLYNAPLYRGKSFLPANLKLEGLWGGAAFLIGAAGAAEALRRAPIDGTLYAAQPTPFAVLFDGHLALAALLAFGGWSVLAALKDEKDVESDRAQGVQTLFTVFTKRGVPAERISARIRSLAFVCMLIAAWAPVSAGLMAWGYAIPMSAFGVLATFWRGGDLPHAFRRTLVLLTLLLATLALGRSAMHAHTPPKDIPVERLQ